jgi:uncharacterized protein YjiS (DUF1127 family)
MMMQIETSIAATGARSWAGGLFVALSRLAAIVNTWRVRHAWRIDLRRLDDHMLRDIGLERCDVEVEIGKPFWR